MVLSQTRGNSCHWLSHGDYTWRTPALTVFRKLIVQRNIVIRSSHVRLNSPHRSPHILSSVGRTNLTTHVCFLLPWLRTSGLSSFETPCFCFFPLSVSVSALALLMSGGERISISKLLSVNLNHKFIVCDTGIQICLSADDMKSALLFVFMLRLFKVANYVDYFYLVIVAGDIGAVAHLFRCECVCVCVCDRERECFHSTLEKWFLIFQSSTVSNVRAWLIP